MKKAILCVVDDNGDSIKDIALIDLAKSNNDYSLEHTNMKAPNKTKLITVQDIDGNFITFSTEELIDSDVIETPFVEELKITLNTLFVASTNLKTIKQNEAV